MAQKEYKQLNCRDAGVECDFLVRAETEEEVMQVAAAHGARVHGMKEITPELKSKMKSLIKTVRV
jgi:predicted small metal-binding protein